MHIFCKFDYTTTDYQTYKVAKKSYILIIRLLVLLLLLGDARQLFAETEARKLVINLYGHLLQFDLQSDYFSQRKKLLEPLSREEQAKHIANDSQTLHFISQANEYARALNMDGMSYLMLTKKVAKQLSPESMPEFAKLFTFAVLELKGYDVLMGVNDLGITVYGRTNVPIKNALFVEVNGTNYYDLSFNPTKAPQSEQLAKLDIQPGTKPVNINRLFPPSFHAEITHKTFPFEYDGRVYFFTSTINQSLVNYYRDLPDIEMSKIYLNYGLSERGNNTLVEQLKAATADMSKERAVNFLLGFVQHLSYAKDADVIGHEKFAFPEEALANEFSDCEDRSMLFAYLVREVASLQSVGLWYEGATHMNVAVENWRSTKGDINIRAFEMDFVVCEPSGKGFSAGEQTMNPSSASVVKW